MDRAMIIALIVLALLASGFVGFVIGSLGRLGVEREIREDALKAGAGTWILDENHKKVWQWTPAKK